MCVYAYIYIYINKRCVCVETGGERGLSACVYVFCAYVRGCVWVGGWLGGCVGGYGGRVCVGENECISMAQRARMQM